MNIFLKGLATGLMVLFAHENALAAEVRGRVLDESTAQPIAGASVRVLVRYGDDGVRVIGSTSSGDDGAYRIDLPGFTGDAAVMAEAPDHAPRNQAGETCLARPDCLRSTMILGSAPATVNFQLPRDARLSGRVVDKDDGSHPGYGVLVLRSSSTGATIETPVTSDGSFRFVGVHAGSYTLVARVRASQSGPEAYPDTSWPERPCDKVTVACDSVAGDTITLNISSEPAPLDVRVRRGAYVRSRVHSTVNGQLLQHSAQLHLASSPQRYIESPWIGDDDGYSYYTGPVLPGAYKLLVQPLPASNYRPVLYPAAPCPGYPCDFSTAATINLVSGQVFTADDMLTTPVPFIENIFSNSFEQ